MLTQADKQLPSFSFSFQFTHDPLNEALVLSTIKQLITLGCEKWTCTYTFILRTCPRPCSININSKTVRGKDRGVQQYKRGVANGIIAVRVCLCDHVVALRQNNNAPPSCTASLCARLSPFLKATIDRIL